jgi:hypothetical protein
LQLLHSDFFGGAWIFHPWPFNFERWTTLNIYEGGNAYVLKPTELPEWTRNIAAWVPLERSITRTSEGLPFVTVRQLSQHDAVMAGMAGGDPIGADDAILGPIGSNGYPKPLWDRTTGKIDRQVAEYWHEHSDLAYYTQKNWSKIGPSLVGKLHFYIGEMDVFYRNLGVQRFQDFLKSTQDPHYEGDFEYGSLNSGWQPMTNAELVKTMAQHISQNTPENASRAWEHD